MIKSNWSLFLFCYGLPSAHHPGAAYEGTARPRLLQFPLKRKKREPHPQNVMVGMESPGSFYRKPVLTVEVLNLPCWATASLKSQPLCFLAQYTHLYFCPAVGPFRQCPLCQRHLGFCFLLSFSLTIPSSHCHELQSQNPSRPLLGCFLLVYCCCKLRKAQILPF